MAKFIYMSKKTRETIANALTLSDKKERDHIINHEVFDLFKAENPDYQVGVSDIAIFQNWKKEFLAKNFGTATDEKPTTASCDKKSKGNSKTTATTTRDTKTKTTATTTTSRDKKSKTTAKTTAPKTKTNTNSRSKSAPKNENAPEIDTCDILAKLKADYISGKISATDFAKGITAIAKLAVEY